MCWTVLLVNLLIFVYSWARCFHILRQDILMTIENCKICQHLIVYSSLKSKGIQHAGTASINTQPPNHETTEITNKNRSPLIKQF